MTRITEDKTIHLNTKSLKILVFDKRRNSVYSVVPELHWDLWDMLMQRYFPEA